MNSMGKEIFYSPMSLIGIRVGAVYGESKVQVRLQVMLKRKKDKGFLLISIQQGADSDSTVGSLQFILFQNKILL